MEAEIRPEISEISEIRAECRRLTLLVNLWRRHRPAGPRPLPRRVAESLGGADTSVPPPALLLSPARGLQSLQEQMLPLPLLPAQALQVLPRVRLLALLLLQ
jgi:hypothetical protein